MSMVKPACGDECPDTTCVDVYGGTTSLYMGIAAEYLLANICTFVDECFK